jgi:hypothetical protein
MSRTINATVWDRRPAVVTYQEADGQWIDAPDRYSGRRRCSGLRQLIDEDSEDGQVQGWNYDPMAWVIVPL